MTMNRPKVHKRNPLDVEEMDPALLTPNQAREQNLQRIERRVSQKICEHRRRKDD